MAVPILVGASLEQDGEQLLERLDQAGLPIVAAFWSAPIRGGQEQLVIASPQVDTDGTLPVYQRIHAALRQPPALHLPLSAIVAVGEQDSIVRRLWEELAPGVRLDHFGIRLTLPYLDEGEATLNLYVYRLLPAGRRA